MLDGSIRRESSYVCSVLCQQNGVAIFEFIIDFIYVDFFYVFLFTMEVLCDMPAWMS